MNKRIFSLVCILFYVFMAVSIYCSEQKNDRSKESGLRSRIIRAIKKIQRSSKKNDTESKRETQLNNKNNNNSKYYNDSYYNNYVSTTTTCWGCCGNKHAD
ncbi:fam-c protein [Plasmodium vinckei brucechwatti]|uniref:Fam-c protein n=1 Tax=Plasmodium vinckei brucechwatti TaxID=119398 RepID=A0A6V7SCU1_PLAVN|nr:fam-c protein [Plasmodium vinckei brucechwatti]